MGYTVMRFSNGIVVGAPELFVKKVLDVAWSLPNVFSGELWAGRGAVLRADPLTRPAAADDGAAVVHPLPQGGEGRVSTEESTWKTLTRTTEAAGSF
jgi:hypothetical protein